MPKFVKHVIVFSLALIGFTNRWENQPLSASHKMSNTILKFIPAEPAFVPFKSRQESAKAYLSTIFKSKKVELTTTEDIEFIDQGSNFERVFCNLCGKEINNDDWQDAMDKAHLSSFKNLSFVTRCCHRKTSLNDLRYDSPAGFARFEIAIADPVSDINAREFAELERILGAKIRKIWVHY